MLARERRTPPVAASEGPIVNTPGLQRRGVGRSVGHGNCEAAQRARMKVGGPHLLPAGAAGADQASQRCAVALMQDLVGLTGIGGGVLMTPFLVIGLGIPPSLAIGTDLAYAAVTKAVGAWQHWRQGTVDRQLVAWMAMGSIPASLVGVGLITFIHVLIEFTVSDKLDDFRF